MMRFWFITLAAIIFTGLQIVIGAWVKRIRPPVIDERNGAENTRDAWLWIIATTLIFILLSIMMVEAWSRWI
ncbi:MAG: hypothetical protein MSG64_17675 [Pyrinomonadaceae bacterium MAG19_C2-C3]|nr:hypothetical protein [Pyrinomonadaceae bacterium MAG19_C2-C3]